MSESEDQENSNRSGSQRSGTVGDQKTTNGINSEQLAQEMVDPLPYKTCSEYMQHLNVWILQTQYWNWFSTNYPLIMSQMNSFQPQLNPSNNTLFNNINVNNNNNNVEIGQ